MASAGDDKSERRRKRPWRKPREEPGPPSPLGAGGGPGLAAGKCASGLEEQQQMRAGDHVAATEENVVDIDGSIMEGGGQILRVAMSLSCLLGRAVHISRIRAGRTKPGLHPQHLAGIQLVSRLCGGRLTGDCRNSTEVTFHPGPVLGGDFTADTHTAGSVCLLLQVSLPCLLFAPRPSSVVLRGGTNADMAPPIEYTMRVFQPIAAKFGVKFDCQLKRRGFFPKGGGEVVVTPTPIRMLDPVIMTDPGVVQDITIIVFVAGAVPQKVLRQLVYAARQVLEKGLPRVPITVEESTVSSVGNSSGIIVVAKSSTGCIFGGSANGRKSDPAEKTGRSAAEELVKNVKAGGCVDEHLQDQLVMLMALAGGRSRLKTGPLTLHTETAVHLAERVSGARFTVTQQEGGTTLLECDGIGLVNRHRTAS